MVWPFNKKDKDQEPQDQQGVQETFESEADLDKKFETAKEALQEVYAETNLGTKANNMNGVDEDRITITVDEIAFLRDAEVEGTYKPPVLEQRITISAQAEGEQVRTDEKMVISVKKVEDDALEFSIEMPEGLAKEDTTVTTGKNTAANVLDEWVLRIQSSYGFDNIAELIDKNALSQDTTSAPNVTK